MTSVTIEIAVTPPISGHLLNEGDLLTYIFTKTGNKATKTQIFCQISQKRKET